VWQIKLATRQFFCACSIFFVEWQVLNQALLPSAASFRPFQTFSEKVMVVNSLILSA